MENIYKHTFQINGKGITIFTIYITKALKNNYLQTNKNSDENHSYESLQNKFNHFPQVENLVG